MLRTAVIVPVLNASSGWNRFSSALRTNLVSAKLSPDQVLVIDSSSDDGTAEMVRADGYQLHVISRSEFNHGLTRQLALNLLADSELLVYMTQDSILAEPNSLKLLCDVFSDPRVGAAYGRQLPRAQATAIETHARLFNYPLDSKMRTLASRDQFGFKSIFFSNSFGAYRRSALESAGGFASDVIFGEDTVLTARLHLGGWQTAYVPEATVVHSHAYSYTQEFKRYFDIGVLHARENWLIKEFGGASSEGKKFVLSELSYLAKHDALSVPSALFRTLLKMLAYRLGRNETNLPKWLKRQISLNGNYWRAQESSKPRAHERVGNRTS